jgi:hypothetical protein
VRVVIYGGRDWDDQVRMNLVLDRLHEERRFTEVINGGQVSRDNERGLVYGADYQAAVWARARGIRVRYFYALWGMHGRAAGPIRNGRMVAEGKPELGIQFPGGAGTRNMRGHLDRAGIEVIEVGVPEMVDL